jgi:hypothetical protein
MATRALAAPAVSAQLAAELQPLRPHFDRPEALPTPLRPVQALLAKGKAAEACAQSEALRAARLGEAARLFFKPDRLAGGDTTGILGFLDKYVRARPAWLETPRDVFVPTAPWRALGVVACLQAGQPAAAVAYVQEARPGAPDRVALAVALAMRAGVWRRATDVLEPADRSTRAWLVRALAAGDAAGRDAALLEAHRQAQGDADVALCGKIEAVLKVAP